MANAHDTGDKLLLSTPELVRDLILGFVPDDWRHGFDYSTLERGEVLATCRRSCRRSCPSS